MEIAMFPRDHQRPFESRRRTRSEGL
jgi:hypothetical protein